MSQKAPVGIRGRGHLVAVLSTALVSLCGSLFFGFTGSAAAAKGTPDAAGVIWVCRPGLPGDPCLYPETAESIDADGTTAVVPAQPAANPAFDCFYVYGTVVPSAATSNAPAVDTRAEKLTAYAQASLFSQVCNVWAPAYAQRTEASLAVGLGNDPKADLISYDSLLSGWKDYLAHYNDGRPIIFIGHSQGAANLIRLLRGQVEKDRTLRSRMVVAIILGGNVQVPIGKVEGGSFTNIPACTSTSQTSCVIAYSSFSKPPPADSNFGRPGAGVSLQSRQTTKKGQQVLCTNPAGLGSAAAHPLSPFFPAASGASEPWVTYPELYSARCESKGGATWLQVTSSPGDSRPVVQPTLGPTWGLHLVDVNLALGNLINDVRSEEAAYTARHHGP